MNYNGVKYYYGFQLFMLRMALELDNAFKSIGMQFTNDEIQIISDCMKNLQIEIIAIQNGEYYLKNGYLLVNFKNLKNNLNSKCIKKIDKKIKDLILIIKGIYNIQMGNLDNCDRRSHCSACSARKENKISGPIILRFLLNKTEKLEKELLDIKKIHGEYV